MSINQEIKNGIYYFKSGWTIIRQKGLKRFVIFPILLNILLLAVVFWLFIHQVDNQLVRITNWLPSWLDWLANIVYYLAILLLLVVYYFIFNTISGIIASPFLGVLAEKVEQSLVNQSVNDDGMLDVIKDTPRMLKRELTKLGYMIPRFILLLIVGFVPIIGQVVAPILVFLFAAKSQTIQYCDYAFDNHKVSFITMKKTMAQYPFTNFSFGALVMICTFIPFVNFLIIPVATCGATKMWVDYYHKQFISE